MHSNHVKTKIIFLLFFFLIKNSYPDAQKIFFTSMAKSGTHLFSNCLKQLTKKYPTPCREFIDGKKLNDFDAKKSFITWHVPYSKEAEKILLKKNFKYFLLYRDPRDRLISNAHWVMKHKHLQKELGYKDSDKLVLSEVITRMIPVNQKEYLSFMPWMKSRKIMCVRYEDLVGPRGKGSKLSQSITIKKICRFLKINFDDKLVKDCANSIYGKGPTYRKGEISSWKKHFTEEQKKLFKEKSGKLLIELGYEKNLDW